MSQKLKRKMMKCLLLFPVCIFPEGNIAKVGIVFSDTGKRNSEAEKLAYHNAADVYWQKSAREDT